MAPKKDHHGGNYAHAQVDNASSCRNDTVLIMKAANQCN